MSFYFFFFFIFLSLNGEQIILMQSKRFNIWLKNVRKRENIWEISMIFFCPSFFVVRFFLFGVFVFHFNWNSCVRVINQIFTTLHFCTFGNWRCMHRCYGCMVRYGVLNENYVIEILMIESWTTSTINFPKHDTDHEYEFHIHRIWLLWCI